MARNSGVVGPAAVEGEGELYAKAAAEYVGLALQTLYNLRSQGAFPDADGFYRNRPFWYRGTLDRFIRANTVVRPSSAASAKMG